MTLAMTKAKENIQRVDKVWGYELWIVNCPEYCGKLLHLDKGAMCSVHLHPKKKETFYCLEGQVALMIEDRDYMLNPFSRPKTIRPGQRHQFVGLTDAVILEISTHHEEDDVVRFSASKPKPSDS